MYDPGQPHFLSFEKSLEDTTMHRSLIHFALILGLGLGTLMACSNGANPVTEGAPGSGAASEGVGDKVSSVDTFAAKTAESRTLDERIVAYLEVARIDKDAELTAKIKETFLSASYSADKFSPELAATLIQIDNNLSVTSRFMAQSARMLSIFAPFYAWQGVLQTDGTAFNLEAAFSANASGDPLEATAIERKIEAIEKGLEYTFQVITAYNITYNTYITAVLSTFWNNIESVQPGDIEMAKFAPGIDFSRIENKKIEYTFRRLAASVSFKAAGITYNYLAWRPTGIEAIRTKEVLRVDEENKSGENIENAMELERNIDVLKSNRSYLEVIAASDNVFIEAGFVMTEKFIERFIKFISVTSGTRDFMNIGVFFGGANLNGNLEGRRIENIVDEGREEKKTDESGTTPDADQIIRNFRN